MNDTENAIRKIHGNDKEQLDIIFSKEKRIIVEAAAGCGKTKTLVSKLAYLLSTHSIPNNKKVLALTFGVNAAYKIKKEVFEKIPVLMSTTDKDLEKKILVTNFHGLARRILRNYGYILHVNLLRINEFNVVDDGKAETLTKLDIGILENEAMFMSNYSLWIKANNIHEIKKNYNKYIDIIISKFLPNKHITYNAILMLALKILCSNDEVLRFYQKFFPYIIIDEFQDTGFFSWILLQRLIATDTYLLFMGDPLQRIYGFIGAIPNLMEEAQKQYSMKQFKISTNYRFKNNQDMLLLDQNIRKNSISDFASITDDASVPVYLCDMQYKEALYVVKKLQSLLQDNENKIAILAQSRTKNLNFILEVLVENSISYFNGLFSEESFSYKKFHQDVLDTFISCYNTSKSKTINKSVLTKVNNSIQSLYEGKINDEINSLMKLLEVFFTHITTDKSFLSNEEKYMLIVDVLSNNALKQSMEYLEENIIITTVHSAKGLEWDYVIIPDMERNSFPNYMSLCSSCSEQSNNDACRTCYISKKTKSLDKYMEVLSIFYVAVTRARKQVFFSGSLESINDVRYPNTKYSCLLSLPGIKLIQDTILSID